MKCKLCGSDSASPSHRRPIERYLKYIIPRTPYRCKECWGRFWVFENPYTTWISRLTVLGVVCLLGVAIFWFSVPERPAEPLRPVAESEEDRINRRKLVQRNYEPVETAPEPSAAVPSATARPRMTEPTLETVPAEETPADARTKAPVESPPVAATGPPTEAQPKPPVATDVHVGSSGSERPLAAAATQAEKGASETGKAVDHDMAEVASMETPPSPNAEATPESAEAVSKTASDAFLPVKKPVVSKPRFFNLDAIRTARAGDNKLEVTLIAGEPIEHYEIFPLKSPPKLVIDLKGNWKRRTDKVLSVDDPMVARVRLGEHDGFLRVVIDLKAGPPELPTASATSEGLRLTFGR